VPRPALAALSLATLLSAAPASAGPLLPWYGDYLEAGYIRTLEATKSPWRAAQAAHQSHVAQMLSVQPQRDGRRLCLTYDWQDVQAILLLQKNGVARRELAWGHVPDMAIELPDATTVCLTAPRGAKHCYSRVGNAQAYITRTALAGSYVDRQGATYRFGNDGIAHFPGDDFRYGLILDQTADPYDFFQIGAAGQFMAFRHDGAQLTLFAITPAQGPGDAKPDFAHPLAVLRPLTRRILASN